MSASVGSEGAEAPRRASAGGRFEIRRWLGAGGSGVVYEAFDRQRGAVVAVKLLSRIDATSLLRFKTEFRTLADLSHPNLLAIHELLESAGDWLLVMELIDGCDLRAFIRPESIVSAAETEEIVADAERPAQRARVPSPPADLSRVRAAIPQLAAGIAALHAGGKLHLDLKPSNVLVDRDGRVVICDFGLSMPVGRDARIRAGTIGYVAPEQAAGKQPTEASDWYSFGVMLYEALAGRRPFEGSANEILIAKSLGAPPPPSRSIEGVPSDLEALCLDLLKPKPEARPGGAEVVRRLGAGRAVPPTDPPPMLLGRDRELATLEASLARARGGERVFVHVTGESGVGKSELVQQFIAELDDALVLQGRCYERESVPYKLLDGVIDELCLKLLALPAEQLRTLVPPRIADLSRLFPVLRRVEAAVGGASVADSVPDPHEAQQRASLVWRELIGRLATGRLVVLAIDDVQWGDIDSIALLGALLDIARASLLVVVGYRDAEPNPVIAALRGIGSHTAVALAPLAADFAEQLARTVMGNAAGNAARIAEEARGNPFLVAELARYVASSPMLDDLGLRDAVRLRLAQLPDPARRLLQIVALAARPLELALAASAAGAESRDPGVLQVLRVGRFVRLTGVRESDRVECYHDAIRETIVRNLASADRAGLHLRLANVLETVDGVDPEELAEHYLGGDDRQRAAHYMDRAAEQAMDALAFDRAARLFRAAVELPATPRELYRLRVRLGDALAGAGRSREAAEAFLAAAELADEVDALDLRRHAAEHFLRSGHLDAGLATVEVVLGAIGLGLASTPRRAVISLALRRAIVRARGLRFTERAASALSREQLTRIDACWSIAIGLGLIDNIRGADFQARHLLAALDAGELYRIARALCLETAYTASSGGRRKARTRQMAERARELAQRSGVPHAIGLASGTAGLASYLRGEWREAVDEYKYAERVFREECVGAAWELANVHLFTLAALFYLGELRELAERTPRLVREAETRGDLYAATSLRSSRANVAWLVGDRPDIARQQIEQAASAWTYPPGFSVQHFYQFLAHTQIDLYTGDGAAAWRRVRGVQRDLRRSFQHRIQTFAIESLSLEGRAALAAWRTDRDPKKLVVAQRCSDRIEREGMAWGLPLSRLLRAAVLAAREETSRARAELTQAAVAADATGMRAHAAIAESLVAALDNDLRYVPHAWFAEQRVAAPARFYAMLAPGPWQPA